MKATATKREHVIPAALANARGAKIVSVDKDKYLFREGERADALYYVVSGRVSYTSPAVSSGPEGRDATVYIFSPGEVFGERCLHDSREGHGAARALVASTLLKVPSQDARKELLENPEFSRFVLNNLLGRIRDYERLLVRHLTNNSERRLVGVLVQLARSADAVSSGSMIIEGVSQSQLADMVGTTRSRISTFMNSFRKAGMITYDENRIQVFPSLVAYLRDQTPDSR